MQHSPVRSIIIWSREDHLMEVKFIMQFFEDSLLRSTSIRLRRRRVRSFAEDPSSAKHLLPSSPIFLFLLRSASQKEEEDRRRWKEVLRRRRIFCEAPYPPSSKTDGGASQKRIFEELHDKFDFHEVIFPRPDYNGSNG